MRDLAFFCSYDCCNLRQFAVIIYGVSMGIESCRKKNLSNLICVLDAVLREELTKVITETRFEFCV